MTDSPDHRPAIQFRNVSYRLDTGYELLRNLNLEVQRGETLVLLGRSGSGKTTTLKLINRLLVQSQGEIHVDGRSTADWDVIRLRRMIGYVIQEVGLFPISRSHATSAWFRKSKAGPPTAFRSGFRNCCNWSASSLNSPRVIRASFQADSGRESA